MATEPDLTRGRQGAQQALAELDNLSRRQAECDNEPLRSTLAGIARRKSGQTWRMLEWLRQHDPGHTPATAAGNGEVIELRTLTPELIVFKVARPPEFQFGAGHSVKVSLGELRRPYSIVSAPHEPFLEFFVELVPGGRMSEQLRRMQVGDQLDLGTPKGGLRFDDNFPHHLMVATVTGINPFVSMLRDYLHSGRRGHHFHLMHGASYQTEFGYRDELEALAAAHPDRLTYVATVSRPDEAANQGWAGSAGRVDTLVDAYLADAGLASSNTLAYACGHSGMLEAVTQQLRPGGFRLETESYD
jgi:NAD(P)H-flavin reductase